MPKIKRNSQLRQVCGFQTHNLRSQDAYQKVLSPNGYVFSRFLSHLMKHQALVMDIFHELVEQLTANLSDFGQYLAVDGKSIASYTKYQSLSSTNQDRRTEQDARYTVKTYVNKPNKVTLKKTY